PTPPTSTSTWFGLFSARRPRSCPIIVCSTQGASIAAFSSPVNANQGKPGVLGAEQPGNNVNLRHAWSPVPEHRQTKPAADPSGNPLVHESIETGQHFVEHDEVQYDCRDGAQNQQTEERTKTHTDHRNPPSIPFYVPAW